MNLAKLLIALTAIVVATVGALVEDVDLGRKLIGLAVLFTLLRLSFERSGE